MCIMWRRRQHKLGIDDFGNPLNPTPAEEDPLLQESSVPVTRLPSGGVPVRQAVDAAVQDDIREESSPESTTPVEPHEETPLLKKDDTDGADRTWFSWLIPKRH